MMRCIRAAPALLTLFTLCIGPARADPPGTLRGTVTFDGSPSPQTSVTPTGEGLVLATTTDEAAAFRFVRVPFGSYRLSAHRDPSFDASAQVDVASDSLLTITLALGELREIGRTQATTRSAAGTPVSQNVLGSRQIAALPANTNLGALITTVPGVVRFSYDEPVAHGYHGITYELDGAPLPQSTSTNFAEIIDPHNIDSLEVFTGAFSAEFGGSRQGAVVNIISHRASDLRDRAEGTLSLSIGSYGSKTVALSEALELGAARLFINANAQQTGRGLDSPTFVPDHDRSNKTDQFVRLIAPAGDRGTLAVDLSNQQATFEIPISTQFNPNDSITNVAGTDDVQREYDRFFNVNYTLTSRDGNGFFQAIPWTRYGRVAYDGDLPNDLQGTFIDPATGAPAPLAGLRQDRRFAYSGLRLAWFRASPHHAFKIGTEGSIENFTSASRIAQTGIPDFLDNVAQRGTVFGAYVQDKWSPSRAITINAGLRYDRSTGFVAGNQLSPRLEINLAPDAKNIVHFYYGRLYAAPGLEDVRRDATVIGGSSGSALPGYDLRPQHDSYAEGGVNHTFSPGFSGYVNYWRRNVANVLDTTQLFPTPIFAVFNNAVGQAEGVELRLQRTTPGGDSFFLSATASVALAGGISGGTFLFPPSALSDASLQPEDHDQTFAINSAYTKRFGRANSQFATLQAEYGSGYPTLFQDGPGRLPTHLTIDAAFGREASRAGGRRLGYALTAENLLGRAYLLKVNNGFNTTQWAAGRRLGLRVVVPI